MVALTCHSFVRSLSRRSLSKITFGDAGQPAMMESSMTEADLSDKKQDKQALHTYWGLVQTTFDQWIPLYDIWKKLFFFCDGIPLSFQFATEICMISLLMLFIFNRQWYLVIPVDVVPRLILGRKQIKCNELS